MTYVNVYLLVYAAMKSLKNGTLSRIMANIEHDSDKIGNLAFYFFTYILEVLEMARNNIKAKSTLFRQADFVPH